jgi:integrase
MGDERRGWGTIKRMRSGRLQASYIGPDRQRHYGQWTFTDRDAAALWLRAERLAIEDGDWTPPALRSVITNLEVFGPYARTWIETRRTKKGPIKPRTRAEYLRLLDDQLEPTFGQTPVRYISPGMVDEWWARLPKNPTQNARAYSLLRSVLKTAVERRLIDRNPCMIRGAGNVERHRDIEPATVPELEAIVAAVPARYRAMILLAAWCSLRFGELTELRRSDLDLSKGIVKVRRGVTWVKLEDDDEDQTEAVVGDPKSAAGVRAVAIPPHVIPALKEHLRQMPVTGRDALLFPSATDPTGHMRPSTLTRVFYRARKAADRPDLRFHDLRHTGLTFAAQGGATLADLMSRGGHSTPAAALKYQHAVSGRDAQIAATLSDLAARR